MAIYEITAPNGKTYEIEGPEGASHDELINALREGVPDVTPQRSLGRRFIDNAQESFMEFSPLAALGRQLSVNDPTLSDPEERAQLGADGERQARQERTLDASLKRRQEISERDVYDPTFRPEEAWYTPSNLLRAGSSFAGQLIGGAAGDPTSLINPGKTVLGQMAAQAGVGSAVDIGLQASEVMDGLRDSYDVAQTAVSAGAGAALTGIVGGISKFFDRNGNEVPEPDLTPAPARTEVTGTVETMPLNVQNEIEQAINHGFSYEGIRMIQPEWVDRNRDAIQWWVQHRAEGGELPVQFASREGVDGVTTPPVEMEFEATTKAARKEAFVEKATEVVDGWTNYPKILVHDSAEEIPELAGQGRAPKGMIDEEGTVHIFADNIDSVEDVPAVIFHESLGHYGMTQQFGQELDGLLTSFYNQVPEFRTQVDEWMARNPGAYADSPNMVARAADEVLAGLSEGGPLERTIMDAIKDYIKNFARKLGMQDVNYSDREIRSILAQAHENVISGQRVDVEPTSMRFSEDAEPEYRGVLGKTSLTGKYMNTARDVDAELDLIGEDVLATRTGPVSEADLRREMTEMGLNPQKVARGKTLRDHKLAARVMGAKETLARTTDELARLKDKAATEGMTPHMKTQILTRLAQARAVYARLDEDTAELGRALRALRFVSESRLAGKALNRMMEDAGGFGALANDDQLLRFLQILDVANKVDGVAGATQVYRAMNDKKWEDYAGSLVFNFMLSSPYTALKNAVGSPANFALDMMTNATAGVFGQVARAWDGDRVTLRETGYRMYGVLNAMRNFQTYKKTAEAFTTAQSQTLGNAANKLGKDRLVYEGMLAPIETPSRVMAGVDEFWGSLFFMSNMYGDAARIAAGKGLKGQAFHDEVARLVKNPSQELLDGARATTERQTFRDQATIVGEGIQKLQTPRYLDEKVLTQVVNPDGSTRFGSNVTKKADSQLTRVGRFGAKLLVPFVGTLDSIARTIVRNTGPLALASSEIRGELLAGGAQRQSALARMAVSSTLLGLAAAYAAEGRITGPEEGDYRKAAALNAVTPPMSVKVGDEWYSYAGFDPIAGFMALSASYMNKAKDDEITEATYVDKAYEGLATMAQVLKESSYAESAASFMDLLSEGRELIEEGKTPGTAFKNFVAGMTTNVMTPAAVRFANQEFNDPAQRDTSGDGSLSSMIEGRVSASVPGLSETLPQRHDVFGRPQQNARQERFVEEDPYVLEINRLEESTDKVVLGSPDKTIYKGTADQRKLSASEYQEYQRISGELILEDISAEIDTEEWSMLTDEERIEIIKEISEDVRKEVRETLFPRSE